MGCLNSCLYLEKNKKVHPDDCDIENKKRKPITLTKSEKAQAHK